MSISVVRILRIINAIDVLMITLIIGVAFLFQLFAHELPCPLCLLQRMGLLAMAFGFLLNIRYSPQPAHYALSLLAAVYMGFVSLRQVALHLTQPQGYGPKILGLHMYTWVFVLAVISIVYIAIVMSIPGQYHWHQNANQKATYSYKWFFWLVHAAFIALLIMVAFNWVTTLAECGMRQCPDNPSVYLW